MKTLGKSLLIGGVIGTMGLGTLAGAGIASAQSTDPHASLIDKIAARFNLDKDEVEKVFEEERAAMEAEHAERISERLQKLVDDGTITDAQKEAILQKIDELKAERDALKDEWKNLSSDERRSKMKEKRAELEAWANEQGLDLQKLHGVFMGDHGHHGFRGEPTPTDE